MQRSVLVVEDDALMRDMIARILTSEGFAVQSAANTAGAIETCRSFDPDALVIDINLGPGPNGFQLAEALMRQTPGRALVFLTNLPDARFSNQPSGKVLEHAAYLRKSELATSDELVQALNAALGDRVDASLRHDRKIGPFSGLSTTQLEVLRLVSEGLTNEQIASRRNTTTRSVERIIARILIELGIDPNHGNPRVEATRAYLLAGQTPQ